MRILLLMFSLFFFFQQSNAQTKDKALNAKLLKKYEEGVKALRKGDYKKANKLFDEVLKKEPNFHEAKLRKAVIASELKDLELADKLYDEIIKANPKYNAEMYLGSANNALAMKNFSKASMRYTSFLNASPKLDPKEAEKIKNLIYTCEFRDNEIKFPKDYKIKPIEGLVNTRDEEFLPSITIDGKNMIISRRIKGFEELYQSTRSETGTWGVATPFFQNEEQQSAAHSISADGKTLVFTRCLSNSISGEGGCDLYISWLEDGKWSKPMNMGSVVNSKAWDSQPCLADNGNTLFFSSNRLGSIGGNDLWMTKRMNNRKWSPPVNLGPIINTNGNEESPFLHYDNKTLFFRSTGHLGMGNYDLFYSKYDAKTKTWSNPINMGYPLNTEGQEGSLFVERDGKTAYYATDIENKKKGQPNIDIYTFQLPDYFKADPTSYVSIRVEDLAGKRIQDASYIIIDLDTKDTIFNSYTKTDDIVLTLPSNKNYLLNVGKEKYYFHSENFNTIENFDASGSRELVIKLKPIEVKIPDAPIVLNNIFFETGSAILLPASLAEIEYLYQFLMKNPKMVIVIIGHTDNVGNDNDNQKLSESRAKAVYDALINKGIPASRLKYEGKGESIPIADNNTAEGRKKNRRTEFKIISL